VGKKYPFWRMAMASMALGLPLAGMCRPARAVVESGHITFGTTDSPSPDYGLCGARIDQTLSGDYTDVGFQTTATSMQLTLIVLDEGSVWYVADYGREFSAATLAAGDFPNIPFGGNPVNVPPGNFYLGVRTQKGFGAGAQYVYGWAWLQHAGVNVVLLDSAVAYGEQGIYIGTLTPVPEPASAAFLGAGAACLVRRMPRRRGAR
jgi:hypothetical protein